MNQADQKKQLTDMTDNQPSSNSCALRCANSMRWGVLASAVILLWATETFLVQRATLVVDTPLTDAMLLKRNIVRFCLDLFGCAFLVCWLNGRMLYPLFIASSFLSCVLLAYHTYFHQPLSVLTLSRQFGEGLDVASFGLGVLTPLVIGCLVSTLVAKVVLTETLRRFSRVKRIRRRIAVGFALCYLSTVVLLACFLRPMNGLRTYQSVSNTGTIYGYLLTWAGEWRYYSDDKLLKLALDHGKYSPTIQMEPHGELGRFEHVVVIQMESVDFSILMQQNGGTPAMPFLHSIKNRSKLYRIQAVHEVGSADADFAFLTGCRPNGIVNPYVINGFPFHHGFVPVAVEKGYRCAAVHGNRGTFFARRNAFRQMGFHHLYFQEELEEMGLNEGSSGWGIPDHEVLAFAAQFLKQCDRRTLLFCITLTTHGPFTYLPKEYTSSSSIGSDWDRYAMNMKYLDQSLATFVSQLPMATLVVLYGDHESRVKYPPGSTVLDHHTEREYVPFIIFRKGKDLSQSEELPGSDLALSGNLSLLDLAHYVWGQIISQPSEVIANFPSSRLDDPSIRKLR